MLTSTAYTAAAATPLPSRMRATDHTSWPAQHPELRLHGRLVRVWPLAVPVSTGNENRQKKCPDKPPQRPSQLWLLTLVLAKGCLHGTLNGHRCSSKVR